MPDRAMILIAEAEDAVRESIEMVLLDEGYDCRSVEDTESLLRAICNYNSDLIIVDIDLIYPDVEEVLDGLHQFEESPPPIIITLNYERIGNMLGLIGFGISEYMLKPFLFEEMTERIQKLLQPNPNPDSKHK
jgi:DNA-binding response OmpR family regulator